MPRALISVYDKTGVAEFARGLTELGYEILSTGGTAQALRDADLHVNDVSRVTGFPEIMDGRVKTVHPAIAGGILARRAHEPDMRELTEHQITPIDLVAINLYPFRETVARPDVELSEALEQIDIGGPTMLRAAAKNHPDVVAVCDPTDYEQVLERLESDDVTPDWRRQLAAKVFHHTSGYDTAIAAYLDARDPEPSLFPPRIQVPLERLQELRYGENPDQEAAFYRIADTATARGLAALVQHHGKELSYNNLLDLDGALMALAPFATTNTAACAIIKHTTPCGIAMADGVTEAYRKALATDPMSAFGSVVALTHPVDGDAAEALAELFIECVVAPEFAPEAMERLTQKKNLRILTFPDSVAGFLADRAHLGASLELRGVPGGALLQSRTEPPAPTDANGWEVATQRAPSDEEARDLKFAWAAIWSVKSNAILLARDGAAIGIGAGQMSRVDASKLAGWKAEQHGHEPGNGCVLASDAFFPFRDGVDAAAEVGVTAVIQPGGSKRDPEVIEAADEHGLAMVLTGRRLFRH